MGLIQRAKEAIERITSDPEGFAVPLLFRSKTGETAAVFGTARKIHLVQESQGQPMNGKDASCSVSEKFLTDLNYPVRDSSNECIMKDDFVTITDSAGTAWEYKIREIWPDETIGLIVCILGDFEE